VTARPRIAFVSREVAPFGGGGIGTYVSEAARALAPVADVTVITTDAHRSAYERLARAGDPMPETARFLFAPEPRSWEVGETDGVLSVWSARAFEAVCDAFPDGGPDLVEFPDYLGEGFATAQARICGDPRVARTTICVRAYTTGEMTEVLDGSLGEEWGQSVAHEIERYALAHADHFVWPGGDVLGTYERFFGTGRVAPAVRVRHPLFAGAERAPEPREADGFLRLLFVGRLERRKGVLDLARALTAIDSDRLRLTFVGGDTMTAPLGQSMRAMLDVMLGGDPRVEFLDQVPRGRLPDLYERHDAVVMPSLWECWPAVGLEALERNRPVLATPTGGLAEIAQPGRSGWLTRETGPEALIEAIEALLERPTDAAELAAAGSPRAVLAELTDADEIRDGYLALAAEARPEPARLTSERPLVSIVVPYYRLEEFVEQALRSVAAQTYSRIETIVVNDGSLRERDRLILDLADRYGAKVITQVNSGLGSARNAGIVQSSGRYVMFLDADNVLRPTFIERCVEVLERHPEFAYVTAWARYIDERGESWRGSQGEYRPLGNWTPLVHRRNVAGDAAAVFRRSVFDRLTYSDELTSFEDWALYREMHERGLIGTVIPKRLLEYRVRATSMLREIGAPNQERIEDEIRARIREEEMEWQAPTR
jgi:glycogen(starch) synthase